METKPKPRRGVIEDKESQVPQEGIVRHMVPPPSFIKRVVWRPNNYRRQMPILKGANFLSEACPLSALKAVAEIVRYSPSNKQIYLKHLKFSVPLKNNLSFIIKKASITGIWSQNVIGGVKETFLIEGDRIEEKKEEIRLDIDEGLRWLARKLGVEKRYARIVWERHEDWIKGEEYVDKLPREVIIHDTVFKKVYGEGLEFIGGKGEEPVAKVKNFVKNRALEDFAPEIARELKRLQSPEILQDEILHGMAVLLGRIRDSGLWAWYGGLGSNQKRMVLGVD